MAENDAQLVARCLTGEEDAWSELILRYERLIYTVPLRFGLDSDQAAEVFQLVCINLLNHLATIRNPERLSAWLVTVARRESWRVAKQRSMSLSTATENDEGEVVGEIAATDPLPDEQFVRLEAMAQVRAGVRQLDDRCRQLLTMLYFEDPAPPYTTIAQQLSLKEGSIGPTRARCLQKLQGILHE